jgi:hypothetical protein
VPPTIPGRWRAPARRPKFNLIGVGGLAVAAGLAIAGVLTLAAPGASGLVPAQPSLLPDSAFRPVALPPPGEDPIPSAAPTPELQPYMELAPSFTPAARPAVSVPQAKPILGHRIQGVASWYCLAGQSPCTSGYPDGPGFDGYAAAGPRLRAAIGPAWRGMIVTVNGSRVKLIDWCQCHAGEPTEKLLDLYHDVYLRTGGQVVVRW